MSIDAVTEIASQALYLVLKVSLPVLLVSLVIGLVISIFTSIQEQTLTFVPKVVGIFLALMLLGGWMMQNMVEFTTTLWSDFAQYVHK